MILSATAFANPASPAEPQGGNAVPFTYRITHRAPEVATAKGQMRSNRKKKKPKQDKNKAKGAEAHSPFAGIHSQVKPGTSNKIQHGKKH